MYVILLKFIWLRQYHTLASLGQQFGISVSNACDTIYTIVLILYEHYVSRYISWSNENTWENQRHQFREFPNAAGTIAGFSVQISRPQGQVQRMYYRQDRGYHFLNFHAVVDNDGYFQLLRGGFLGHVTDAHSLARLPTMGYR